MPEFNLIQRPDWIQRLTRVLALKQPHVVPTLNEGVQAVVILDDIRRDPGSLIPSYVAGGNLAGNTAGLPTPYFAAMQLKNPTNSGYVARVLSFEFGLEAPDTSVQQFKAEITTGSGQLSNPVDVDIQGRAMRGGGGNAVALGPGGHLKCDFGGDAGGFGDHMWTRMLPSRNSVYEWRVDFSDEYHDVFVVPNSRFVVCMDAVTNAGGYGYIEWQEIPFDPTIFASAARLSVS